ncbi:hypothetical protein GCM10028857_29380 [Salinarchaeum chitinilyticum]
MSSQSSLVSAFDTRVVGDRVVAQIVDYGCVFCAMLLVLVFWGYTWDGLLDLSPPESPLDLVVLSIGFCYNVVTEDLWNGQTVGKRLVDIRVRSDGGGRASLQQIALRNLPALLWSNGLIYVVGLLSATVDERNQRNFDKVADTVVVDAD